MEINVSQLKEFGEKYKVLYVEDDEIIRDQTKNFLGRFFKHVDIAEDGALGWEQYQQNSYDIVVTDINMPNMNGIEMIEKIKEHKEEQIILVTSAHNDSENLLRLINLNIMRFVLKPFDFKKFLIVLYNIIKELHDKTQLQQMQEKLQESSALAQTIVDSMEVGIIVFENEQIAMANQAFLQMYDFDAFETLVLEMPEIGVLFQDFSSGISVQTNAELIRDLKTRPEDEQRVRILQGKDIREYQVKLSVIDEEKGRYVVSFTDITQTQSRLTQDAHTKLPHRQVVLEEMESLATTSARIFAYCIRIEHFESVLKWYGKKDAIALETEMAEKLKLIVKQCREGDFLGYFDRNQYIIFTQENYDKTLENEIKSLSFEHNKNIDSGNVVGNKQFRVSAQVKQIELDMDQSRDELEVLLMNTFDALSI